MIPQKAKFVLRRKKNNNKEIKKRIAIMGSEMELFFLPKICPSKSSGKIVYILGRRSVCAWLV